MKYFTEDELMCKCGCGLYNMTPEFEVLLDKARQIAGVSFVVTSGCRCVEHNNNEGGSYTSSHLDGVAVDVKAEGSATRSRIIFALVTLGVTRIGIDKNFIHFDVDLDKPQKVMWLY